MGAYYQFQIIKNNHINTLKTHDWNKLCRSNKFQGLKFLEHGYHLNSFVNVLYDILKNCSNHDNTFIINTVCDYDEKEAFKYSKCWEDGTSVFKLIFNEDGSLNEKASDKAQTNLIKNYKTCVKRGQDNISTEEYYRTLDQYGFVTSGFIVNKDLEQYINLDIFTKHAKKEYIISPISILTRSQLESQGGGDFSTDFVKQSKYRTSFSFERVASWKDCELYFVENLTDHEKEFTDISLEVLISNKYQ